VVAGSGTFPAGVHKRLVQEYRAHIEESVAAGRIGDPVALFGDPKEAQRQLEASYANTGLINEVKSQKQIWFWLLLLYLAFSLLTTLPIQISLLPYIALLVICVFFVIKWLTKQWPKVQRIAFQRLVSWCLVGLLPIAPEFDRLSNRNLFDIRNLLDIVWTIFWIYMYSQVTLGKFRQYACLRRTLELEQVAA
jgi:hypothetical protein